jgi:signal transduction histidine kinase/ligand-binding sensor domain-containing protein/DNA-binding response OmpR family regulator
MSIIRYLLIVCGICWSCTEVFAQDQLKFKRINSTHGLPHNTVFCITQDVYGFMWFGTRYGLARYDGHSFKTFNSTKSVLANHAIRDLLPKNDSLYYLATEGGLYLLNVRTNVVQKYQTREGFISSRIVDLAKGPDNSLWLATEGDGAYRITSNSVRRYRSSEYVISVAGMSDGRIYLSAAGDKPGLFIFDPVQDNFKQISPEGFRPMVVTEGDAGSAWVGTQGSGVYRLERNGTLKPWYKIGSSRNSNIIRALLDDGKNLIVATEGGLAMVDKASGRQQRSTYSPNHPQGIADNALYSLCKDKQGGVWIGSYFRGASYLPFQKELFESHPANGKYDKARGTAISSFYERSAGRILVTSEDEGISVFNPDVQKLSDFAYNQRLSYNNVHDVCEDNEGNLWVGMYLHGIDIISPNGKTKKKITSGTGEGIHSNSILRLLRDRNGNIHIGTVLGSSYYDRKQQKIIRQEITHSAIIRDIMEDSRGNIWYVSMNRGIFRYQPETGRWTTYNTKTYRVPTDKFVCAREDSTGAIWFGTEGFGLIRFDRTGDRFEVFNTDSGLPDNYIFSLECEGDYLWIGTTNGLCRYRPKTGNVKTYTEEDGLAETYFNYNASRKMSNGDVYFGTINGFVKFNPSRMEKRKIVPPAYITSVVVSNRNQEVVRTEEDFGALSSGKHEIVLPYQHNTIRIGFTALSYNQPSKTVYKYMLEGFDAKWNLQLGRQHASYGNLLPGKYIFKLLVSNGDDVWLAHPIQLNLTIKQPFWNSVWAWLVYALCLLWLFILIFQFVRRREKAQYKKMEDQRKQEATSAKVNFFTNLTHEIKTPLSLLKVPIEVFKEDRGFPEQHKKTLEIMDKNASWLEHLVNELLEFQKIGEKQYELNIVRTDLVQILSNLFEHFNTYAQKYDIQLRFLNNCSSSLMADVDPQALLKAISNLLVNGFKHTRSRLVLSIRPDPVPGVIRIAVHDNGQGIAEQYIHKVFEPFTQFGDAKQFKGVGIGLAYARSLVQLHDGTLALDSKEGYWCVATIRIPLRSKQLLTSSEALDDVVYDFKELAFTLPDILNEEWLNDNDEKPTNNTQAHILLVEDTIDIAYTLVNYLKNQYRVGYCKDGLSALSYVDKFQPDVVISDVIMPGMDGVGLCRNLKEESKTSHIQVVLLTAKTTTDDRIVGLEAGADAYINKPFLLKEVALTIKNLLRSRVEISNLLRSGNVSEIELKDKLSTQDTSFVKRVSEIVNTNLDNPDFKLDDFSVQLGVSKTLVYIKLKKLFNMSPNEYIMHVRFNKAKEILCTGDGIISEVAYQVGFSDPNYFSRAFKQHEGVTPTVYRRKNAKLG